MGAVVARAVEVGVLGPTTLSVGGRALPLSPTHRRLLAALASRRKDGATRDRLVRLLWGESAPASALASLHNHLTRLRRLLPDEDALSWDGRSYRLDPRLVSLDTDVLESALTRAARQRGSADSSTALRLAEDGLARWRGEPYDDLDESDDVLAAERTRLHHVHADLEDVHAEALLATGRLPEAVLELQRQVRTRPQREQVWTRLLTALARSGRRAEALEAYVAAHRWYEGEMGIAVPQGLRRLHAELLSAPDSPEPAPSPTTDLLVGRDVLVDELDALLDDGLPVLLCGEAGVGKTSVARAVARRRTRDGRLTAHVTCLSNPWSALQPVLEVLGQLRPELLALDPPVGAALRPLVSPARAAAATPDASVLEREVADALARVAATAGGLTLVLDDAHRGGPTSRRFLLAAVERSPLVRLLMTTRQQEHLPPAVRDASRPVQVLPLDADAVTVLVRADLPGADDVSDLVTWLLALTGGNPLYLVSVLRRLLQAGLRPDPTGAVTAPEAFELPEDLRTTLASTIGSLSLSSRIALDVAAVLDDPVSESVVGGLADPGPLEAAVSAGVLRRTGPGVLQFSHDLFRRTAYDLIPAGRRLELHHEVAAALVALGEPASRVAAHALAAQDLDPLGACQAAESAGAAALAALAHEEAAQWYDRAADLADRSSRTEALRLRVEAADARRLAGAEHADALLELAEQALALDDPALRTRATLAAVQLGGTGEPGPRQVRAAALAVDVLALPQEPHDRAAISAAASLVHSLSGEAARCRQLLVDAVELLEDEDPVTAVQVLPYAYMGLAHAADLDRREAAGLRLLRDAAALDDPVGRWEGWHLDFTVALQRGDGVRARAAHDRLTECMDAVGDAGRRWSHAYQDAAVAQLDGRLDDAERAMDLALQIGTGVAPSRAMGAYAGQLLELRRLGGRVDELAPLLGHLVEEQSSLPAWVGAASFVLATSDPARSAELFDRLAPDGFAALPRDFAWLAGMQTLARGAVLRADAARAKLAADLLAPYADRVVWQGTCTYGPVATVLAETCLLAGDHAAAAAHASTALRLATSLRSPAYVAEASAVLARCV